MYLEISWNKLKPRPYPTVFYVWRTPPLDAKGLLLITVSPPRYQALVLDHGWLQERLRPTSTE